MHTGYDQFAGVELERIGHGLKKRPGTSMLPFLSAEPASGGSTKCKEDRFSPIAQDLCRRTKRTRDWIVTIYVGVT